MIVNSGFSGFIETEFLKLAIKIFHFPMSINLHKSAFIIIDVNFHLILVLIHSLHYKFFMYWSIFPTKSLH